MKGRFFDGGKGLFPHFYADFAARSIFRTRLPCASASLAGLARTEFLELQPRQPGEPDLSRDVASRRSNAALLPHHCGQTCYYFGCTNYCGERLCMSVRAAVPDMTYNVFGGTLNLAQLNSTLSEPFAHLKSHMSKVTIFSVDVSGGRGWVLL